MSTHSNPIDTATITKKYTLTATITQTGCHKTDSVLITVVPKPIVKIQIDSADAFTRKFIAKNPNEADSIYKWRINDSDIGTGFNKSINFKKTGHYKISLAARIPGFCDAKDSVEVDIEPSFSLNIFPNPFAIQTDIRYILTNFAHVKISILDMLGRDVSQLADSYLDIGEYNTVFKSDLPAGMYLVVFQIDDKIIVRKIVQAESVYN